MDPRLRQAAKTVRGPWRGDGLRRLRGRRLASPPRPKTLDRFRIVAKLGEGSTARVYEAVDAATGRRAAIKVLSQPSAVGIARLAREARALSSVCHPNVIGLHELITTQSAAFIVMELVRGTNLRRWLRTPRTPESIAAVMLDVALGLGAVHGAGLVHHDVKPENIVVGDDGRARVADLGLTRPAATIRGRRANPRLANLDWPTITRSSTVMGTPLYLAPEQYRGAPACPLADQFSFAITLHEAFYRRHPFRGDTLDDTLDHQRAGLLQPLPRATPIVSPRLYAAIMRALAPGPADRHADLAPLATALLAVAGRRQARPGAAARNAALRAGRPPTNVRGAAQPPVV